MADVPERKFESGRMTLGDHLEELRARVLLALAGLVVGWLVCLGFGRVLLGWVAWPYEYAMAQAGTVPALQAIHPAEKLMVYFKTCFLFGFMLAAPWVGYQLWAFVSAGLYPREKRYVYAVVPIGAGLFIGGALFFLLVVAPLALRFFVQFDPGIDFVRSSFTLKNYVDFIVTLALVFGAAFELPIFLVAAERLGLVSVGQLQRARKYVLLVLVFAAAVMTPPDVLSQVALAIPLYALFEGSILVCRLLGKKETGGQE